jgi:hypothetical protein
VELEVLILIILPNILICQKADTFFFLMGLGIEPRAPHMLGKHSSTFAALPALMLFFFLLYSFLVALSWVRGIAQVVEHLTSKHEA